MFKKKKVLAWLLSIAVLMTIVAPATFASQGGQEADVEFKVTSDWGSGFSYTMDIKNTGTTTIKDWKLTFDYTGTISSVWNANLQSNASSYTIINAGWNKDIEPGQLVSIGGNGIKAGQISNIKINGIDANSDGQVDPEEPVEPVEPEKPVDPEKPEDNNQGGYEYKVWNPNEVYTGGQSVSYNNSVYEAKWWNTNERPDPTNLWGVWKLVDGDGEDPVEPEEPVEPVDPEEPIEPNPPINPGVNKGQVLVGYWHNFDNGSSNIRLRDIPEEWDVVQVAFGETRNDRAVVEFEPYNATDEEFRSDIAYLNSRGVRVLLSLGGQNGVLHIDSPEDVDKFFNSVTGLIDKYGFDGFDIDVENGITVSAADKDLKNPSTPRIKYMVEGINRICDNYDDNFWLTMAPEIAYVQGGITAFAGPWGAYLPIIEGTRHNLTMLHVQHYNCGGNAGLDGATYNAGTADFQVAMVDMLLQGFNIAGDPNAFFEPLRPDQVGIGIPAKPSAAPSGGYISPAEMQKALDYIMEGKSYGGNYKLQEPGGYPGFRGLMTWSINWDATQGNSFAKTYSQYFKR